MIRLILFILLITIPTICNGQVTLKNFLPQSSYVGWDTSALRSVKTFEVLSTFDTILLNRGNIKCNHKWATKLKEVSNITCAVYHGELGCPEYWINNLRICIECLRHERIIETREYIDKADKYTEAFNRLKRD